MPKIDVAAVPKRQGSGYPPPFDAPLADRVRQRLGDAGGLNDFGVNLMRLPPGNWSSQRHWHSHEDEFVYVLEGELTLIEDGGETVLRAGDCAAFPKGTGNGHHLINRSGADRRLSRGRLALARRPHHLLRHRHDERQRRRPVRAQGRHAVSRVARSVGPAGTVGRNSEAYSAKTALAPTRRNTLRYCALHLPDGRSATRPRQGRRMPDNCRGPLNAPLVISRAALSARSPKGTIISGAHR